MKDSVFRDTKVILVKQFDKLQRIGETYEVGNITDSMVVLRDVKNKVAVGAVTFEDFDTYFEVKKDKHKFTEWQAFEDGFGNTIGFYRTNQKKVQVKLFTNVEIFGSQMTVSEIRAEASCHKGDTFNLYFGLRLAFLRAVEQLSQKALKENGSKYIKFSGLYKDTKRSINNMLSTLENGDGENVQG